ncbi:MAG: helix-turn-helix domain-containing protein [Tenacibaculum sp.]
MNYLISIIVFQAIFSFILLVSQKNKDEFERLIALFAFFISLHLSTKLAFLVFLKNNPVYYNIPTSFSFVYGPILYFAIKSLTKKILIKSFFLHLIPFIFATICFIVILLQVRYYKSHSFLYPYKVFALLQIASLAIYPVLTLRRANLLNKTTNNSRAQFLKLLSYIFIGLVVLFFAITLLSFLKFYVNVRLTYVFFLATTVSIVLFKVKTYHKFNASITSKNSVFDEQKYSTSNLSENTLQLHKLKIKSYFKEQKPYLIPSLTLQELSKKLNIPKHHVSQVLNTGFNKNFYQFINEYRINAVIQKMSKAKQNETIIGIAFSCGFNSKSTFNTYFKKITGKTPKAFKKTLLLIS